MRWIYDVDGVESKSEGRFAAKYVIFQKNDRFFY